MDARTQDGPAEPLDGRILERGAAALILATVFASGAAVMIVEMTAVRAVQPFFGSTMQTRRLLLVGLAWVALLLGVALLVRASPTA